MLNLLVALAHFSVAPPRPLPVVHGDLAAPAAWASVHEQRVYVCWEQRSGCFEAVELGGALASPPTQLAFVGPHALVVSDGEASVIIGPRGAQRPADGPSIATRRPAVLRCSPTGSLPFGPPSEAVWLDAPCTGPLCPGPTPVRQPRRYGPKLALGLEIQAGTWSRDRRAGADSSASPRGGDITAIVRLSVSLPTATPPRRDPPQPTVRRLPLLVAGGPPELQLAAEQTARNIVCPQVAP